MYKGKTKQKNELYVVKLEDSGWKIGLVDEQVNTG